ncbi:hypothetical protein EV1_044768 [Malus domestica]
MRKEALLILLDGLRHLQVLNISHCLVIEVSPPYYYDEILDKLDPVILNMSAWLQGVITCMQLDHCIMCQRIRVDLLGIIQWYKYEEGLWKRERIRLMRSKFKTFGHYLAGSGPRLCSFVCLLIQVRPLFPLKFYPRKTNVCSSRLESCLDC